MGILKDAINDVLPKKKEKQQEKSDHERLQELKAQIAELEKQEEKKNVPEPPQPVQEVSLETKIGVLEHNMMAIMNEFDDRVRAIEQFLIRNYNQNQEK